ncbi:hypothetical protein ACH5RR_025968, partial [Cinchona calisaya]
MLFLRFEELFRPIEEKMGNDRRDFLVMVEEVAVIMTSDVNEMNDSAKKPTKKGELGDEDVDIDDDMHATSFLPVEIEKGGRLSYVARNWNVFGQLIWQMLTIPNFWIR